MSSGFQPDPPPAGLPHELDLDALVRRARFMLRTELSAGQPDPFALAHAVDARDGVAPNHSLRVARLAGLAARALGLSAREVATVELAGLLHDVGKLALPVSVLTKNDDLSDAERAQIRQHPQIAHALLREFEAFTPALPAVLAHHELFDGSGYPFGQRGEEIDLGGRILRVVDGFERASEQAGANLSFVRSLMEQARGQTLDPQITRAYLLAIERLHCESAENLHASLGQREAAPGPPLAPAAAILAAAPLGRV